MERLDMLTEQLRQGAISRRDLIASAALTGIALTSAGSFARAASPQRGGTLRIGLGHGSTTDTLDPATYNDSYMQTVGYGFRNCLTEIDNHDELVGELAESWEASADAASWTFKLRSGVEFHNGKSLTPEDVIASVQHHLTEDSQSPAKAILNGIREIRKDGPDSVTFTLASGNADFPYLLSDYHVAIMPTGADGTADWQSGIGTGGYVLKEFEPGVRSFLERNPNYFKSDRAHFDAVEALALLDNAARTSALISGKVDVVNRVDLKTVDKLSRLPGIRIEETEGNLHMTYEMMVDVPPYDDINVRLALKYGIDRQALLDKLLFGHGYLGNDHPIGKANRYFAADLPQRPYDPDKAKWHLKQAGLTSVKAEIHAADAAFAGAVDGAVLYREAAASAGIDLNLVRAPNDGYWSNTWNVKPFTAVYWAGRATEDWMFSSAYAADAPWNGTRWKNPRFNELLLAARAELDTETRRAMYFEMQQLCSDDGGLVAPIFSSYVFATSDKVAHDDRMSAAWDLDGIKCLERWWFS